MARRELSQTPDAIRNRRHYALRKNNQAVGRYLKYGDLITALVQSGIITEAQAYDDASMDAGVHVIHERFVKEIFG